jgi:hypothetical protein
MKMSKFALKIKTMNSRQVLWRLDPPLDGHEYIITSASDVMFTGPETYIFPADKDGNITDWCELRGSYRGELNHKRCFANIGYCIK